MPSRDLGCATGCFVSSFYMSSLRLNLECGGKRSATPVWIGVRASAGDGHRAHAHSPRGFSPVIGPAQNFASRFNGFLCCGCTLLASKVPASLFTTPEDKPLKRFLGLTGCLCHRAKATV